jgi:hypothetical protein
MVGNNRCHRRDFPQASMHPAKIVLFSQMTGTWSVFETLSGDLWEHAINAYPQLALAMGKVSVTSINRATRGKFDTCYRLDTALRYEDAYNFTRPNSSPEHRKCG